MFNTTGQIDEQIKKRPVCSYCKEHPGLIFYNNKVICGDCYGRIQEYKEEKEEELIKEALENG